MLTAAGSLDSDMVQIQTIYLPPPRLTWSSTSRPLQSRPRERADCIALHMIDYSDMQHACAVFISPAGARASAFRFLWVCGGRGGDGCVCVCVGEPKPL